MHDSKFWFQHYQKNLKTQRIDWSIQPTITDQEKQRILYSLKAWQLGETSEGKHLRKAAAKYARKIEDPFYGKAIDLFIKEEQKHGNNLGRYLDQIGEKRKTKDWGDTLFRKVRHFNTHMELWTITVIIVESAAQIFYQALHDAAQCTLLRSICQDILIDEAHHVKFQNERLRNIFERKNAFIQRLSILFYSCLFILTIYAIWLGHRRAFLAGGVNKSDFIRRMHYKFFTTLKYLHASVGKADLLRGSSGLSPVLK
ncbi:MAG: ferritin-like domain-containing protein [Bacteroidota bacterium]